MPRQALAVGEHRGGVGRGGGHDSYPDFGTPVQVKMTCFGYRDAGMPAPQLRDERPDDGPLLFQRADVAQQHVHCQRGYVRGFSRISKVSMTSSSLMSL